MTLSKLVLLPWLEASMQLVAAIKVVSLKRGINRLCRGNTIRCLNTFSCGVHRFGKRPFHCDIYWRRQIFNPLYWPVCVGKHYLQEPKAATRDCLSTWSDSSLKGTPGYKNKLIFVALEWFVKTSGANLIFIAKLGLKKISWPVLTLPLFQCP